MTIVREGQAPYTSTSAVMQVIDRFRHRNPATPVTVEVLEMLGIGGAIAPRTLQALKLLDLLDEDGQPTQALRGLREASPEELPTRLAEVVRAAYAEVFSYHDPVSDPPERLVEAFRRYNPASMRPRMVRLFYGLCHEAGIIAEVPSIGNVPQGSLATPARQRNGDQQPTPKPAKPAGTPKPPKPPEHNGEQDDGHRHGLRLDGQLLAHLHPALIGLLATVPPADEPWSSRERFETFKTAFEATLQISNPVPREREGEQ